MALNRMGGGLTATAIVLAGALLRPGSTGQPQVKVAAGAPALVSSRLEALSTTGDGPWRASCNYWRPGHWIDKDADTKCGADGWGIATAPGAPPRITAIIATVPDPVHSSLSLEFDRSIDVLTQAAAVNGFVGSYFWLPWRQPDAGKADGQTHHQETTEDLQREKQPGLLILKRADAVDKFAPRKDAAGPYPADDRVIYLFLVGQTPAVGINGDQLQEALHDEAYLQEHYGARLSLRHPEDQADVIGPINSGSARSLRTGLDSARLPGIKEISVVGNTETNLATEVLNSTTLLGPRRVKYLSFGDDAQFEQTRLLDLFSGPHPDGSRIAFLLENGTVFGAGTAKEIAIREDSKWHAQENKRKTGMERPTTTVGQLAGVEDKDESAVIASPLVINFPREISLLRNAQSMEKAAAASADAADGTAGGVGADSFYLHLSLVDPGVEDTVPHFSQETPPSQEAQLMAIGRELRNRHIEVVAVSASNILDELFLAKFLRREVPDARLIFFGSSDLMFVRVGDNSPYLGSIALTAYPFTMLSRSGTQQHLYNFANAWTEGLYNAASYTFWDGKDIKKLMLTDYRLATGKDGVAKAAAPYLWATAAGRDGYYPLGTVNGCASDNAVTLPTFAPEQVAGGKGKPAATEFGATKCNVADLPSAWDARDAFDADRPKFPALSWYVLCLVLSGLCVAHCGGLSTANFWSPATRDLDLEHGDQPRRRAMFLHIATAMLWSMCVVTTVPLLLTTGLMQFNMTSAVFAVVTLGLGFAAILLTLYKTWRHVRGFSTDTALLQSVCASSPTENEVANHEAEARFYPLFNGFALLAAVGVPVFWVHLNWPGSDNYVGLFFGFRCLHPLSAVSPLPPILLLLVAWYLWAYSQTRRLRFSENSRPMLPKDLGLTVVPLYVSDDSLRNYSLPTANCLYENMMCLFITRQMMRRVFPGHVIGYGLVGVYTGLFAVFVLGLPIHSLDHFLRRAWLGVTWYEVLMGALFYPLLVIALTGAVRMWVVWGSLRRGVLQPLERSPLRFSFSRLTNAAWTNMLKQGGLIEYWRDMNRSTEAVQQMSHTVWAAVPGLTAEEEALRVVGRKKMRDAGGTLEAHQRALMMRVSGRSAGDAWDVCGNFLSGRDLPEQECRHELNLMCAVECDFSIYAEGLLAGVLAPYWQHVRDTPVEADALPTDGGDGGGTDSARKADPPGIGLAEEFLAIRYVSLIRAVLINVRQLMMFVSAAFVLATVAWSCYPFEPRQWIDYAFTGLLGILGVTVIMVLMQLHRDPIMSRITGTAANELGGSFYLRLAGLGAVPVLTWLASQFPGIGGGISKLVESGMAFAK